MRNCWRKAGILPAPWHADIANKDERRARAVDEEASTELAALIEQLQLGADAITVQQYISMPGEDCIEQIYSDEQLLDIARGGVGTDVIDADEQLEGEDGVDCNEIEPVVVTREEAVQALQTCRAYMLEYMDVYSWDDMEALRKLMKKTDNQAAFLLARANRQVKITSYFGGPRTGAEAGVPIGAGSEEQCSTGFEEDEAEAAIAEAEALLASWAATTDNE